jgi:hypothetical protein
MEFCQDHGLARASDTALFSQSEYPGDDMPGRDVRKELDELHVLLSSQVDESGKADVLIRMRAIFRSYAFTLAVEDDAANFRWGCGTIDVLFSYLKTFACCCSPCSIFALGGPLSCRKYLAEIDVERIEPPTNGNGPKTRRM